LDYYYTTLINYKDWLLEKVMPYHWRDHEAVDPIVAQILKKQETTKKARIELSRNSERRKKLVRSNYKVDVNKAQQSNKICNNWFSEEVSNLQQKRDQLEGIVPQPGKTYEKIPGWVVSEGDSNFRGTDSLCQQLQCSEGTGDLGNLFDKLEHQTNIQNLHEANSQCQQNNEWNLKLLKESEIKLAINNRKLTDVVNQCLDAGSSRNQLEIGSSDSSRYYENQNSYDSYQRFNDHKNYENQLNSQTQFDKMAIDRFNYKQANAPEMEVESVLTLGQLFGEGHFFDKCLTFIILPLRMCDPKATFWNRRPPIWPIRYGCIAFVLYVWYHVATVLFRVINYGLDFLPNPPEKNKTEEEPNEKKKSKRKKKDLNKDSEDSDSEDGKRLNLDWVKNVLKIRPGGGKSIHLIDPIFILIHIHKIDLKINQFVNTWYETLPKAKVLKKVRKRRKFYGQFLLHASLATLAVGNSISSPRGRIRQISTSQEIYEVLSNDGISDILNSEDIKSSISQVKVGDKILTFESLLETTIVDSEKNLKVESKSSKNIQKKKSKKSRVMKLSDLPALSESDFEEFLTESPIQGCSRIRVN
jgi:hypothetical protein